MDIDLKINDTPYSLLEDFDFQKLTDSGFTKGSFLARKAGGAGTGAMVYLAKECGIVMVKGKVRWTPSRQYDGESDRTWSTRAYLVYRDRALCRVVVQQLGNRDQAKVASEAFVQQCQKARGWKLQPDEAAGGRVFRDERTLLACQLSRSEEDVSVVWEATEEEG